MTTKDHNETLAGIHVVIGVFFAFGLIISPWVIGHRERTLTMVVISVILLPLALLMFWTAIAMHRKKPAGRTLALWSVSVLLMIFWPAAIYSWWFMHSEGASFRRRRCELA